MTTVRRRVLTLVRADTALGRSVRGVALGLLNLSLPMPAVLARSYRAVFVAARGAVYWCARVFVAEPIFRGYATRLGRNFHTGVYVHWVVGDGRIVVGDDSRIDGKCNIMFAWSEREAPEFSIGDRTHIGHECSFTIAKSIRIGNDCMFASGVRVMDSSAHPVDPARRLRGERPRDEDIRPVIIGDNVWVGAGATILPGVEIGSGSVIAAGAVITRSVPPDSVAGGVPARILRSAHDVPPSQGEAPIDSPHARRDPLAGPS